MQQTGRNQFLMYVQVTLCTTYPVMTAKDRLDIQTDISAIFTYMD